MYSETPNVVRNTKIHMLMELISKQDKKWQLQFWNIDNECAFDFGRLIDKSEDNSQWYRIVLYENNQLSLLSYT